MFDLSSNPTPVCVSLMREGRMVCSSVYFILPDGEDGERVYGEQVVLNMEQAAELSVPFILEGADDGL
jgi:hypothetical protein